MVRRAVDALAAETSRVVVVSSKPVPEAGPAAMSVIPDVTPGKGPLGGLEAALREAAARGLDGVLLLACDLPAVTPALLAKVAEGLENASAVAPSREGGGIEPLCAAYRVETLAAVERRLSSEDLSLHALFRDVGGRASPAEELGESAAQLLNVNTPEDLPRAEALLGRGGGE
jgi:molybdopterin-guanine dinucleotide biosynthesis protein A